jgi:uncharacterized protein YdaU (DUF1376 family)
MSRPWMPLYVGDYLADTAHLRAAESGAYIHLIMHYWRNEGLPDDDMQLAAIARMTLEEWQKARPLIEPLFKAGRWKHKRIETELAKARQRTDAARGGANARWHAKRMPEQCDSICESGSAPVVVTLPVLRKEEVSGEKEVTTRARDAAFDPLKTKPEDHPRLVSPEAIALADDFCIAIRAGPDDLRRMGMHYTAQVWVARGYDRGAILALAADIAARWPDKPIKYFERAIERDHAERVIAQKNGGGDGETRYGGRNGRPHRGGFALYAVECARAAERQRGGAPKP